MIEPGIRPEDAVLAAMMKRGVAEKYIDRLTPEDFSTVENRRLYTAMQALYIQRAAITMPTMSDMLNHLNGSDAEMELLIEYAAKYPLSEYGLEEHIRAVRQAALRRQAKGAIIQASLKLDDAGNELDGVLSELGERLRSLERTQASAESIDLQSVLIHAYGELEDRGRGLRKGMNSGIASLDAKTAGFHKGELTIIGARPAVGKSAIAAQIALSAAKGGAKVLMCSREMTAIQYGIRVLMRGTKVASARLRSGQLSEQDWTELSDSLMLYSDCDIRFTFDLKYVEDLRRKVEESEGLDMLVVDYVQLLQARERFEKDYLRVGYISKALKDISTDYNIAVIALAQVGRSADGSMPSLSELRGSGDLEQDADNVIFMHRPESATDKWVRPDDKGVFEALKSMGAQYIVLNIAKQRQGETGCTAVGFKPQSMTFSEIRRREE